MLIEHPGPRKYLLHGLSEAEADFRPNAHRFSIREVVAHLADCDAIFHKS